MSRRAPQGPPTVADILIGLLMLGAGVFVFFAWFIKVIRL